MFIAWLKWFHEVAHHPMKVLTICLSLAAMALIFDGTAIRLWSLHREHDIIGARIAQGKARAQALEFQIHQAEKPEFIERAARDQFDLVKEGDLVFIFADENTNSDHPTDEKSTEKSTD